MSFLGPTVLDMGLTSRTSRRSRCSGVDLHLETGLRRRYGAHPVGELSELSPNFSLV